MAPPSAISKLNAKNANAQNQTRKMAPSGRWSDHLLSILIFLTNFGFIVCPDWGGIWCYRCVSTQPGCGLYDFDWRWHWQWTCPRDDDKCVKLIERKGADVLVTRECLSHLEGIRRDIPSDRYEGCRPAAKDVKLGNYVFNDIKELDVKRDEFDEVTFCFCELDDRCNRSSTLTSTWPLLLIAAITKFIF